MVKQLLSYNSHNSVYVLNIAPDDVVQRLTELAGAWQKPAGLQAAGTNWGFQYDVATNLAFMPSATQSSTCPPLLDKRARSRAEIAVDGVTEGNGEMEQISITENESDPCGVAGRTVRIECAGETALCLAETIVEGIKE